MKKIVVTGEKGGTGKSTISALLIEYLNFIGEKVILTALIIFSLIAKASH